MTSDISKPQRPARISRWVASGLTAAVAVGSVAAMADGESDPVPERGGEALGAVARYRGELAAAALMAAADPGDEAPPPPTIPLLGAAGVS